MAGKTKVEYSLELDVSGWKRGVSEAIREVRGLEQVLDRAIQSVNQFEQGLNSALKGIKDANLDISIDASLGTVDSRVERLLNSDSVDVLVDASEGTIAQSIDELLSTPTADIRTDASKGSFENTIEELLSDPTADIRTDASKGSFESTIEELLSDPSSTIEAEAKLKNSDSEIDELLSDPSVDITVNVKEGTITPFLSKLLTANAAINLAVNITGLASAGAGQAAGLAGFFVDPLIEADTAVARFEARTGQSIENIGEIIENVYIGGWGESRAQVGDVVTRLVTDLKVPADELENISGLILDTADILDADWTEVVSAAASMVDSGLAPSIEDAFGAMITGQQEGLNRAGDLIDTFREYSSTFVDMGFTTEDVLSTLNAGLEAGIDNTDRIADSIREAGIRATTDFDTKKEFFDQIGFADEAQAFANGEITGKQYMDGLFKALGKVEDQSVRELLQDELIGTISEDFGAEAISALGNIKEHITLIGDEAAKASTKINDTIGVSWTTIKRTFQSEVADYFNTELEFTGFLQRLKDSVTGFFSDLKAGEGFGDALSLNIAMAVDDTEFGNIVHLLIDALLSVAESIVNGAVSIIEAIDSMPGVSASSAGAQGLLEDVRSFRFNIEMGRVDDMTGSEFYDFLEDANQKQINDIAPRLGAAFTEQLSQEMSGLDAAKLFENISMASGFSGEEHWPMFQSLAQQAADQAKIAMEDAFAGNDLSEAMDIAKILEERAAIPAGTSDRLAAIARLNITSALSTATEDVDLDVLPNIWDDYLATEPSEQTASYVAGRLGLQLDEIFRQATQEGDQTLMNKIIGVGDEMGLDISFWETALRTAELETEMQSIQETIETTGTEGETSIGVIGVAANELQQAGKTSFGMFTDSYSAMTAGVQADGLLIEEAFIALGEAWNLLPETLRSGMANGFHQMVLPAMPGGGGGGSSTTINQSNTFNNQSAAASSASGQAVANAIGGRPN